MSGSNLLFPLTTLQEIFKLASISRPSKPLQEKNQLDHKKQF